MNVANVFTSLVKWEQSKKKEKMSKKNIPLYKLRFSIEFFSWTTVHIVVFYFRIKTVQWKIKLMTMVEGIMLKNKINFLKLYINRRLKDWYKTESTSEKILTEQIFYLKTYLKWMSIINQVKINTKIINITHLFITRYNRIMYRISRWF